MQKKRGLVISNCQAAPLAQMLGYFCRDMQFTAFSVNQTNEANRAARIAELLAGPGSGADVVLSVPLSAEFGALSRPQIAGTFAGRPVLLIHNIYFAGLHPDLTYVGGMGQRVQGPMGDYHSRIVALSVAQGLPPETARALFRPEVYRALGYNRAFAASLAEFRERELQVDVPFADRMARLVRRERGFLTVNHPTAVTFAAYAQVIVSHLEERGLAHPSGLPTDPSVLPNALAPFGVFPVYPEIAARHRLPYSDPYLFRPGTVEGMPNVLTLDDFVALGHAALSGLPRDRLAASPHLRPHMDDFARVAARFAA
ncbi:MAG: hypothetical protein KF887_08375 [Paracoccaceae bacterium]|nr:MAG: hypothetical protein KF887_08375 [Paracoccaceae bacterium]